ncbi:MAG: hypothetical protein KC431_15945 [Myxococcales bacterium]|nr:hypothetical protein [Myxococcales bacterium]
MRRCGALLPCCVEAFTTNVLHLRALSLAGEVRFACLALPLRVLRFASLEGHSPPYTAGSTGTVVQAQ